MQAEDYEYLYALEEDFWWFAGMRAVTSALLDPFCSEDPDRTVLDAGCGTGSNLAWLCRYADRGAFFGIDLSTDALRFCRTGGHGSLARASVTALPFSAEHFDLVTSFDVLAQLSSDEGKSAVGEMFRVLRPGGISFVRTAAYEWMHSGHDEALGTQRRYNLDDLESLLAGAGFDLLRSTYANSLLLPIAAVRRLVLKRTGLADSGSDVKPLARGLRWLNGTLQSVLDTEANLLGSARIKLPAGLSAICIAQKPHKASG
jgi:SAM-dependent methyltransferase